MRGKWTRTHDALGARAAIEAVERGAAWLVIWCGGKVSRSTDQGLATQAVEYARRHVIEPAERERLFEKAQRKRRTKTVVMAERWENRDREALIGFYEDGPYLLPDCDDPENLRQTR